MLGIVLPFTRFADIIAVLLIAAVSLFDMHTIEFAMHRVKHNATRGHHIDVRMRCPLFTNFVAHTPILQTGKLGKYRPNLLVGIAVVNGVIDCQLKFAGTLLSCHITPFT